MKTIAGAILLSSILSAQSRDSDHGNENLIESNDDDTWTGDQGQNDSWDEIGWGSDVYMFSSVLGPDPTAVPFWKKFSEYPYTRSNGMAELKLTPDDGMLYMLIKWELLGDDALSYDNHNIGLHVHAGDPSQNGPIVWGFCGEDPLPPFGGPCSQMSTEEGIVYTGQICDMAPPAPCYMDGKATAMEAAQALINGTTPMYVNLHTTQSLADNGGNALGLIRGQLMHEERPHYTEFASVLGPDPTAVPFWDKFRSYPYTKSNGMAAFELDEDGTMRMLIKWELLGDDALSHDNHNIGLHVHAGDPSQNGPIVWGFCGEDPLPPFGGPCSQMSTEEGIVYTGQICDMAPPAPCYMDGKATAMEAAQALINGTTPMYVNLHTTQSLANNGGKALGLIRGQLMKKDEGSDRPSSIQSYQEVGGLRGTAVKTSRKTIGDE